jgi:hypothetical protein
MCGRAAIYARVRARAERLAGRRGRFDGTKLRVNLDPARKAQWDSTVLRGNITEEEEADHGSTSSVEKNNLRTMRSTQLPPASHFVLLATLRTKCAASGRE